MPGMQRCLHAGHGVDLPRQRGDEEGIHHRRRGDLELDRAVDGGCHFVHGRDALLGVDEQPFPVQRHHFDHQRLSVGRHFAAFRQARERAVGVELVRADPGQGAERDDDKERRGPDQELQHGGVVPFRIVAGGLVAGAVAPREQQGEDDDRDDDEQHQAGRDEDQVPLLHGHVARGREQHRIASGEQWQGGKQDQSAEPWEGRHDHTPKRNRGK
ncbi:hypothetical protein D9M70_494460 [compost metagenome]